MHKGEDIHVRHLGFLQQHLFDLDALAIDPNASFASVMCNYSTWKVKVWLNDLYNDTET